MGIAMSFASPVFMDIGNLQAILLALSVEATIAVRDDASTYFGRIRPLGRIHPGFYRRCHRSCAQSRVPTFLSIIIGLIAALSVGLINGLLVAKMKINPFITTLGMSITIRGLLLVLARGRAVLNLRFLYCNWSREYIRFSVSDLYHACNRYHRGYPSAQLCAFSAKTITLAEMKSCQLVGNQCRLRQNNKLLHSGPARGSRRADDYRPLWLKLGDCRDGG